MKTRSKFTARKFALGALVLCISAMLLLSVACNAPTPTLAPTAMPPTAAPIAVVASPTTAPVVAASPVAATSGDQQSYEKAKANWPQVVAAAQKEGTATIYCITPPAVAALFEQAFNKIDPKIQVKLLTTPSNTVIERLKAEAASKQYVGNGYISGSVTPRALDREGMTQTIDDLPSMLEPGVKWVVSPQLDKPRTPITLWANPLYFLVNTKLAPEGQYPKSWKDMIDPKWKDKIVVWDPRLNGAGSAMISMLYTSPDFGPDYVKKLLYNVRVVADPTDPQLVARGEYVATLTSSYAQYDAVKDAPVKLVAPEDGIYYGPVEIGVVKNAPQLNVTKVYLNWLLSKEGQQLVSANFTAIRSDIDPTNKFVQFSPSMKVIKGVPPTPEWELGMDGYVAKFKPWLDEQGK